MKGNRRATTMLYLFFSKFKFISRSVYKEAVADIRSIFRRKNGESELADHWLRDRAVRGRRVDRVVAPVRSPII